MSHPNRFDWPAAHGRISAVLAKLDMHEHPDSEDTRRILHRRAVEYAAQVPAEAGHRHLEVIGFEIGGDRFAIDMRSGGAATSLTGMTAIPGVPSFYLGLVAYRGTLFPIIDVRPLLGIPKRDRKDLRYAVLVRNESGALGLAAEEIEGIVKYRAEQIAALDEEAAHRRTLLGIGPKSTMIIDIEYLMNDVRLLVDEQSDVVARKGG